METKSAAIHRKMSMPAPQLPITGFAHKAAVVGDGRIGPGRAQRRLTRKRREAQTAEDPLDDHSAGLQPPSFPAKHRLQSARFAGYPAFVAVGLAVPRRNAGLSLRENRREQLGHSSER
jgi:hypothetical protein